MKHLKLFLKRASNIARRAEVKRGMKRGFCHRSNKISLGYVESEVSRFLASIGNQLDLCGSTDVRQARAEALSQEWRSLVRQMAGLGRRTSSSIRLGDLAVEVAFLWKYRLSLAKVFKTLSSARVLFSGQAYYNAWYLSRALRGLGWKADLLNWDENPGAQIYYHGEDFRFGPDESKAWQECLSFYLSAIYGYDVFHFSNSHGISFGWRVSKLMAENIVENSEIYLLKDLGKVLVYSNNGCQDGVSQTAFSQWGPESPCSICRWQNEPTVCSDERNLSWGRFRNSVIDYQCLLGGNRVDFNDDPRVHEVPEFYCLDPAVWDPTLELPEKMRLSGRDGEAIRLYHAVGHRADRTRDDGVNIKSSHVYLPLISKLQQEGMRIELIEPTGIPNKDVRFLQMQADIFLDMLTFGWFGANAREAMMLAKPVICYIRPEWLDSVREQLPEYVEELPIVSATPDTVEEVLRDLIAHPEKRREIGERSRRFAIRWHSSEAAGRRFDQIYSRLLNGDSQNRISPGY